MSGGKRVLVTGGAGYIGSHTVLALLRAGWQVVVLDNLQNASEVSVHRVARLAGQPVPFVRGDVRDADCVDDVLRRYPVCAAIHFAGLKAVGESVERPLDYYATNVTGTQILLSGLQRAGVRRLVFSSSATVYGDPTGVPVTEGAPIAPASPYGHSKRTAEQMLEDLIASEPAWSAGVLRYFNPIGADESGQIGEDPAGVPHNLLPYISQVAVGCRDEVRVFGGDWPTPDGTCIRDYVHVTDVARGHLAALSRVMTQPGAFTVNLGTGRGTSVLEMIRAFERVSGVRVPFRIVARRPGDIAQCYAEVSLAKRLLDWQADLDIDRMCADAWRWQRANPRGYAD